MGVENCARVDMMMDTKDRFKIVENGFSPSCSEQDIFDFLESCPERIFGFLVWNETWRLFEYRKWTKKNKIRLFKACEKKFKTGTGDILSYKPNYIFGLPFGGSEMYTKTRDLKEYLELNH